MTAWGSWEPSGDESREQVIVIMIRAGCDLVSIFSRPRGLISNGDEPVVMTAGNFGDVGTATKKNLTLTKGAPLP